MNRNINKLRNALTTGLAPGVIESIPVYSLDASAGFLLLGQATVFWFIAAVVQRAIIG